MNWLKFPKTDLHRHLEGAIRLSTIRDVSLEAGVKLPTMDLDKLADHVQVRTQQPDLSTLLNKFWLTQSVLATPRILERISYEAVEDAYVKEGIDLLELRYSPGFICVNHPNLTFDAVHRSILDGIARAQKKYPVKVGLLCIISRDIGYEAALQTCDFTIQNRDTLVGFDLAGDEVAFDAILFTRYFQKVREKGLHITVHAGEARVPEAPNFVRNAIQYLGAERIGHGLQIIHDPTVIEYVKKHNVVLELCPVSNYLTKAIDQYADHPIRKLMDSGVQVTVNSDDPGLFGSSILDDYNVLETYLGFTEKEFMACDKIARARTFIS